MLSADCTCANLTNEIHVLIHKNAYRSFCGISAYLSVWSDKQDNGEPWDTAMPSRRYTHAQIIGGASWQSFMVLYTLDNWQRDTELRLQVVDETRAQYHALALCVSFLSGYCSVAYRYPRSANYITSEEGLHSTKYYPRTVCANLVFIALSVDLGFT